MPGDQASMLVTYLAAEYVTRISARRKTYRVKPTLRKVERPPEASVAASRRAQRGNVAR
jgi:hypothetical protein